MKEKKLVVLIVITCSTKLLLPSSSELNRSSKSPNICLRKSNFSFEKKKTTTVRLPYPRSFMADESLA